MKRIIIECALCFIFVAAGACVLNWAPEISDAINVSVKLVDCSCPAFIFVALIFSGLCRKHIDELEKDGQSK